jgi:hypothetical protein
MHSLIGRKKCPWPIGERVSLLLDDGATLTYDVYQPLDVHSSGGIEDIYIRIMLNLLIFTVCFIVDRGCHFSPVPWYLQLK